MSLRARFQSATRLFAVFVVVTTTLAIALAWVSWRLIQQDRELERQRRQDRLGQVLDTAAAGLLRTLANRQQQVLTLAAATDDHARLAAATIARGISEDSAVVVLGQRDGIVVPEGRILFFPIGTIGPEAGGAAFAAGELAEFQRHDSRAALAAYAALARSPVAALRAGALLRSARVHRTAGRADRALEDYAELARMARPTPAGSVGDAGGGEGAVPTVGGVPVDLVARHATCAVMAESRRQDALHAAARSLHADLLAGHWRLARGTWAYYVEEARRWLDPSDNAAKDAERVAETAFALSAGLDHAWHMSPPPGTPTVRVDHWRDSGKTWVLLSARSSSRFVALLVGPREMSTQWLGRHQASAGVGVALGLSDATGEPVVPLPDGVATQALRAPADTGLPWTLLAAAAGPLPATAAPRTLLLAGIGVLALLLAAGAFFIGRAIARELEVARMQSDFVAAVSHEFRTPLSSVCHISEMLVDGRVADDERRSRLYATLQHESERLRRLVEGLLDFARIGAGGREYRLERLEPSPFLQALGREFQADVTATESSACVEIDVAPNLPAVRADREALGRAVWNVLDNAVKYSPGAPRVRLAARAAGGFVDVVVQDEGLGISPDEQPRIFQKFVRGSAAAATGVKGTGLGLSMVRHIAEAHGGTVRVDSRPGEGSTFTIAVPTAT